MDYLKAYYLEMMRRNKKTKEDMILTAGIRAVGALLFTWIAFQLTGLQHSFLKALLIAVTTLIPLTGSGLVFVPWILVRAFGAEWTVAGRLCVIYILLNSLLSVADFYLFEQDKGIRPMLAMGLLLILYLLFFIKGAVAAAILVFVGTILFAATDMQNAYRRRKIRASRRAYREEIE